MNADMPRSYSLALLYFALLGLLAGAALGAPEPGRPDRESLEAEQHSGSAAGRRRPEPPATDKKDEDEQDKKGDDEEDKEDEQEEKPPGLFGKHLHGRGGIEFEYVYTGEVFNNTRGGLSTYRAVPYRGNLDLVMKADLEKMGFGPGGKFFLYGENGHGFGPTRYVGDFQIASNIDAPDFMQVAEYWYERGFCEGLLTVRLGKQDCNAEFVVVDLGGDFINASFGYAPTVPMPSFPNPSMGIAAFLKLGEHLGFKAGVWDGMPEIGNWGFSGTGVTFTVGELKAKYDLRPGLPGDFHAGVWYHSGQWEKLGGVAAIESFGPPPRRLARYFGLGAAASVAPSGKLGILADSTEMTGNYGVYLGLDQLVFKENAGDEKDSQGLGVFAQYGWSPEDRNWAHQYIGGGLVYRGLVPSRDTDLLGAGVAHVIFSDALHGTGHETAIELYYKAILRPWVSLQPDLQYIVSPSGVERDSLLVGLRTEIVF